METLNIKSLKSAMILAGVGVSELSKRAKIQQALVSKGITFHLSTFPPFHFPLSTFHFPPFHLSTLQTFPPFSTKTGWKFAPSSRENSRQSRLRLITQKCSSCNFNTKAAGIFTTAAFISRRQPLKRKFPAFKRLSERKMLTVSSSPMTMTRAHLH